ncbi:Uncharacterised protein [Bordetella pertussis]|nr:Uncharacterised protein [Bordetella pertussis]CFP60874.1 Uncharacterised protein [Bordetella pertussis]
MRWRRPASGSPKKIRIAASISDSARGNASLLLQVSICLSATRLAWLSRRRIGAACSAARATRLRVRMRPKISGAPPRPGTSRCVSQWPCPFSRTGTV